MEKASVLVATFLLNALWQVAAIAVIAGLCSRAMRNVPARYRHTMWVAALALGVILPLAGAPKLWVGGDKPAPAPPAEAIGPADFATAVGTPGDPAVLEPSAPAVFSPARQPPSRPAPPIALAPSTLMAVTACYVVFLLVRLAGLYRAVRRTRAVRREAHTASLPTFLTLCMSRCQAALGLREVPVLCSARLSVPLTVGARRPVIILPESLVHSAAADELTSAVGHEMAHVRRGDFALNALCELLYVPISFHPAAALMRRKISQTRELACDEMVIESLVDPFTYASSLVRIASSLEAPRGAGYGLGVLDGGILEERVRRLIDRTPRASARLARFALATASAVLIASGAWASAFSLRVTPAVTAGEDPQRVARLETTDASPGAVGSGTWSVYDQKERMDTETRSSVFALEPAGKQSGGMLTAPAARAMAGGAKPKLTAVHPPIMPSFDATALAAEISCGGKNVGEMESTGISLMGKLTISLEGPPEPVISPALAVPNGAVRMIRQSTALTTFRLEGFEDARIVTLAGSFNDWDPSAQLLTREGDEWVCRLELPPGKYGYKFVVDGKWMTDPANPFREKDGHGNTNSNLNVRDAGSDARYVTFTLDGFADAASVVLAGSFNDWHRSRQRMVRENDQWVCRVKLGPGKHFYKFIVDGEWMTDPANDATEDDGRGNTNSVLTLGS
jgi:beta-lactamase regulating signal transducer with metallopeptidase domain